MKLIIDISKTQREILYLFFRFRFLSRFHLQKLLTHKNHHRVQEWLDDLVEKELLVKDDEEHRIDKTKPIVYHLNTKSIGVLKTDERVNKKILRRFYRESKRVETFAYTCLIVADIYLYYLAITQKGQSILNFYTPIDLWEFNYLPSKISAYLSIEKKGRKTKRYFIEVIKPNTYSWVVEKLVQKYLDYFDDNTWQETTNYPFPTVLFVCPNPTTKRSLEKHLKEKIFDEYGEDITFECLTTQEIKLRLAEDK